MTLSHQTTTNDIKNHRMSISVFQHTETIH